MFRRRRLFYRIARICMVFIFGLVVAVVIALSQVNLETLRGDLLEILRDATGLQVEIDGDVSWKFSLRPRVELNKIRVPNEGWAKNPDGFTARKIDLTLNLISLLQDRPTIQNVKVYDVKMFIEENDKGKLSIKEHKEHADGTPVVEAEAPTTKQFEKYPFADPGLGSVEVRNFVLNYNDTEYRLSGFNLAYNQTVDTREYAGWMKIDTKVYPFIISFSGFNAERKIYPMRIALSTGGEALVANVALEGTSKMPIDFKLNGNIPNVAELGKIVGVPVPDIPMMKLNLAGGFDFNKIIFKKSTINVRDSDLTFSGSVDWNNKIPKIVANLSSNKFDLTEVFPFLYAPGSKWVRPKRDLHVFKDIPLYGHEMRNYDLDARADFKNLIAYRELNIQNIDLDVRLKDGRARLDAIFNFTGGDVSAALEIDSDSNGMLYARGAGVGRNVSV
ncbi:AsmA family protein, partial [Lachnospiraceae bacterium OttesenSCG-928-E19]|nr:AsmA family protein [Lachnospiraceae bacterium OttesenSCG-928-E19]